ncbi:HAMP domain-containing sensor histidine kinase [Desulfosporosinus sp. PR]|uniref:sensor histidine kinase n=1 Tax=Candidatus Desulfosporosinus nitrosoreducens TaxID=3401928 RepID=UPI0027F11E5D|nr:HAMP domain-containing sensor histidine kinase [Desulfosporosinus sp. PR]MDQ7095749.1 HAMP domain-containing sensor histidine kinase [Desulfosporosinus sp. PR]
MLNLALFLVLISLSLFWGLRYYHLLHKLQKIRQITQGIQTGNLNLRYRLGTDYKELEDLGGELNRLVDSFQKAFERTRFLEEERKRMIANISHDLRTPLTSLLGYLEALQNDETLTVEEKEGFLGIAGQKGKDLLSLLQDFFELTRLEADDALPELQKVNLTEIVPEVLVGFYPDFVQAGITPAVNIPDAPLYVWGDVAYLRRILNNLLTNALRYGQDGKEIGIGLREAPEMVWVEVWDRGKGIRAQDLPHIFERLYTGEASRNTSLRGSGLGLTIVKNQVEKQGGRITVASIPGEKTIFSFGLRKS